MNLNNLAGEKSDVRIQHASIVSGNLALVEGNNQTKSKQLLKKKKMRPISGDKNNQQNKNNDVEDKKANSNEENNEKKHDKSIYLLINIKFLINRKKSEWR
jgi:hypothetical protein